MTTERLTAQRQQFVTRLFEDKDLPAALDLWEKESGWGSLSAEQWNEWYRNTPHGDCLIVVTTDIDGAMVGQIVLTPSIVRVDNEDFRAFRVSAPILSRTLRSVPILSDEHPLRTMFAVAMQHAVAGGAGIVYATPWEKWLPLIQLAARRGMLPTRTLATVVPCAGIRRNFWKATNDNTGTLDAAPLTEFTSEHSDLWEKAVLEFPLGACVMRTPKSLEFRHGGELLLEVRDRVGHKLSGYVAIRKGAGLIMELIAETPAVLAPVVQAVMRWLDSAPTEIVAFDSIQFMDWPVFQSVRTIEGYENVPFNFGFFAIVTDDRVGDAAMDINRWFITPGD